MKVNASNVLLMFRSLEEVIAGVKVEGKKSGDVFITHPSIPLGWIVQSTGFKDRTAACRGDLCLSAFRPGDTFTPEPMAAKSLTFDGAANVSAVNDLVNRTAKALLAALLPVALSEKREEIKVVEHE